MFWMCCSSLNPMCSIIGIRSKCIEFLSDSLTAPPLSRRMQCFSCRQKIAVSLTYGGFEIRPQSSCLTRVTDGAYNETQIKFGAQCDFSGDRNASSCSRRSLAARASLSARPTSPRRARGKDSTRKAITAMEPRASSSPSLCGGYNSFKARRPLLPNERGREGACVHCASAFNLSGSAAAMRRPGSKRWSVLWLWKKRNEGAIGASVTFTGEGWWGEIARRTLGERRRPRRQ